MPDETVPASIPAQKNIGGEGAGHCHNSHSTGSKAVCGFVSANAMAIPHQKPRRFANVAAHKARTIAMVVCPNNR